MGKAKDTYTIDEVVSLLGVNRSTVLVLLETIRPGVDPKVKKIRTSDMERMYGLLKKAGGCRL